MMAKVKRNCLMCDKEFYTESCWVKRGNGKFCSYKCKNEWWTGKKKSEGIKKICQMCGKEFRVSQSVLNEGNGKFCSQACFHEWYRGKNTPQWKGGMVKQICQICGKEFYCRYSQIKAGNGKFCSTRCANKQRRGEKNPNWQGGISENYQLRKAERGLKELREKILKRDNYTCQKCGVTKVVLDVHHIIPWLISHDDSENNLITVCKSCHGKTEINRRDNAKSTIHVRRRL